MRVMRNVAWILLLAPAGCWYDRPNPWDTSGDVEDLEEKTHQDWMLDVREPYVHPQQDAPGHLAPELEVWRDTVLAFADGPTLTHIRTWTTHKISVLEKEQARLLMLDPHTSREPLTTVAGQLRTEKLRLRLVLKRSAPAE